MEVEELALRVWPEGDRLTETDLVAFETTLTHLLPGDFRRFLLLSGGGGRLFDPLVYEWQMPSHLGSVTAQYAVAEFCAPGGDEYHSIRPLHRHIEDMGYVCAGVPRDIFVFADDWSGNFLTIDLRPDSYGYIGLVDHETVGDNFEDDETYMVIASSFSAFAARLRDLPEEAEPIRDPIDPSELRGPDLIPPMVEFESNSSELNRLAATNRLLWKGAGVAVGLLAATLLTISFVLG